MAIDDQDDSTPDQPATAADHVNRGHAWSAIRRYDEAIADFTEALRLDPYNAITYYNRGWVWDAMKRYDEAIADYDEAIRLRPTYADAHNNRGIARAARREYGEAIADFTEVLRLQPEDAVAHHNRGLARESLGKYAEALSDFNKAIRIDSESPAFHNARAWLLATAADDGARDGRLAVESATRACELGGWNSPNELDTLAAASAEIGDFSAAVKWQEMALELLADADAEARSANLGRLELYRNGRPFRQSRE